MKLETSRLILRDWKPADAHELVDGLNQIDVARWLAFVPHPYTVTEARAWIRLCRGRARSGADRSSYDFAIELKHSGKVIGGVSLNRISLTHGTAGGGIWLNARYQSKGYGREALGEKIRFAFEDLKLRRLEIGYFRGNRASARLQKQLGYRVEGLRRKAFRCMADSQLKDEYATALLREDWIRPAAQA